ncbi:aspartyl/asparaginyl beta-hydroxylase-like isoform X2 [Hemicordylus capensis]|uniref:aspartyl/asparaginyl beta-hydroxylase-like isoform X2 n=1 Tax=Hemicordylus capensis TaxID=884348 RepID=UPI0023020EF5|nr:aspartyl/asparaginyl beta-hydroxylase-like isoform X2 [Hemicordylus capensis]
MAPRKSPKSGSPGPGARRETKHGGNKNGKKEGLSGSSFFTWFMVIALLGVWTSVAVVWFELVDYEEVLAKAKDFRYNLSEVLQGKLGIYDADGDGDFDVEDAKVLLGLTKDGNNENIDSLEEVLNILAEESSDWFYGFLSFLYDVMTPFEIIEEEESDAADDVDGLKEKYVPEQTAPKEAEDVIQAAEQQHLKAEHRSIEVEPEDEIESLLREVLKSQLETDEDNVYEDTDTQEENSEMPEDTEEVPIVEEDYEGELEDKMPETLETPGSIQEEPASDDQPEEPEPDDIHDSYEYHTNVEENTYEPEGPDDLTLEDALEDNTDAVSEDAEQKDYVDEHELEHEDFIEAPDRDEEPLTEHNYEKSQEPVDSTEQRNENEVDTSDSVTEHNESDEREHAESHATDQPREKVSVGNIVLLQ